MDGRVEEALTSDPRDTLAEAGPGAALHRRGALAVIHALIRCHLEARPVVWWAAPPFFCTRTLTSCNQGCVIIIDLGIAGSNPPVSYFLLCHQDKF